MKKAFLILFVFIFEFKTTIAQKSGIYFFSGIGRSINLNSYNFINLGTKIKLFHATGLYFNTEAYYSQKNTYYTYYTKNDYSYFNKRYALVFGFDYNFKIIRRLEFIVGANVYLTKLKSQLRTSNTKINEILLNDYSFYKTKLGMAFVLNYKLDPKNNFYVKLNMQGNEYYVLPNPIFSIGYMRGFKNKINY